MKVVISSRINSRSKVQADPKYMYIRNAVLTDFNAFPS